MPEQDVPESDDQLNQGAEVVMPPDSGGSLGSYFILPLAWPSSHSYYISMTELQP